MSKYTTGELAKLCGVTVRTVQYYDTRGILSPSELSEGGRRLYTDDDLRQLRIICFLRDMGLPIDAIGQLLAEEEPGRPAAAGAAGAGGAPPAGSEPVPAGKAGGAAAAGAAE